MPGVLEHSDVQESVLQPFKCHRYITNGMEDNFCIQMLYQVLVKAEIE